MSFNFFVRFVLISVMLATTGCSWPGIEIGGEKYLLSPTPTNHTSKTESTPGDIQSLK